MSPQVKKPVPSRRYFPQNLLGREASKKFVRAINLGVPCFQPESDVRAFVSHGFVSCQQFRFICILEKSFRTWARHFSIALRWPQPESRLMLNEQPVLDAQDAGSDPLSSCAESRTPREQTN